MSYIGATSGNIYVKHNDKWRGDYYLTDNLTFTVDKDLAGKFYLLKQGDTTILNGDRITINSGNRTLVVANNNNIRLIDRDQRDQSHVGVNSFIITNGIDNTDPITYENTVFLISDKTRKTALQYIWGMDLIGSIDDQTIPNASNYKPRNNPTLINGNYGSSCDSYIGLFEFSLERVEGPILNQSYNMLTRTSINKSFDFFDAYGSAVIIMLLMIVLVLCILVGV